MILGLALAWYVSGIISMGYWWTKEYDLDIGSAIFVLYAGFAGPLAFLIGMAANDDPIDPKIIIMKKRVKK